MRKGPVVTVVEGPRLRLADLPAEASVALQGLAGAVKDG